MSPISEDLVEVLRAAAADPSPDRLGLALTVLRVWEHGARLQSCTASERDQALAVLRRPDVPVCARCGGAFAHGMMARRTSHGWAHESCIADTEGDAHA